MEDLDEYRRFIAGKFTRHGIGSTGVQAAKMRRYFLGVELKREYAAQAARFVGEAAEQLDMFAA